MNGSANDWERGSRNIERLPEEFMSHAISLSSRRDACRSDAVSLAFRAASASDAVWERFLPSDCGEILSGAVDSLQIASKKHLLFPPLRPHACRRLQDEFALDRETGGQVLHAVSERACDYLR